MDAPTRFEIGRVYRRADIHAEYGGQQQGGIATPTAHPLVLLITGQEGEQYGYNDHLDEDGIFHYYGEGTLGEMVFTHGNRAIRDHAQEEEELHLFEKVGAGRLRYMGEKVCSGFEWITDQDWEGNDRRAIVFQLTPADEASPVDLDLSAGPSLQDLAALADADPTEESAPSRGLTQTRRRSAALRAYVRARSGGLCEGCGMDAPFRGSDDQPFLEAHHTERLSDFGPGDRSTVIALCPNCHARVHYGQDGDSYNKQLAEKLPGLEAAAAT